MSVEPLEYLDDVRQEATIVAHIVDVDEHGELGQRGLCGARVMGVPAPPRAPLCVVCIDLNGAEPHFSA